MSPRAHFLTGIPVAIAGATGSLFVIAVNGFMQHPTGFKLENGEAVDVKPFDALFGNSFFWHEFVHMYLAAFIVAGFLVAAVYATALLRGRTDRFYRTALLIPLTVAAFAAPAQLFVGDWAARRWPTAAGEARRLRGAGRDHQGGRPAPARVVRGRGGQGRDRLPGPALVPRRPRVQLDGEGLDSVPPDDRPKAINLIRYSFEIMVGIGTLLRHRRRPPLLLAAQAAAVADRWFLRAVVAAGPLRSSR